MLQFSEDNGATWVNGRSTSWQYTNTLNDQAFQPYSFAFDILTPASLFAPLCRPRILGTTINAATFTGVLQVSSQLIANV